MSGWGGWRAGVKWTGSRRLGARRVWDVRRTLGGCGAACGAAYMAARRGVDEDIVFLLGVCLDEADGPLKVRCDDVVQRVAAVDEEAVDLRTDVERVRASGEDGGDVERAEGWIRR